MSTFQDLYNTGLKVVVTPVVYDELATTKELSSEFMKRFINSTKYQLRNKNWVDTSKTYFISEISGKLTETRFKRKGRRLFKLSDLCILSHYHVHRLHMKSPFKNEFNRVLLSLAQLLVVVIVIVAESGFVEKYVDDFWKDDKSRYKNESKMTLRETLILYTLLFSFIIMDYIILFITFLEEIIAGRVLKCKHFSLPFSYCKSIKMSKQLKTNTKNTIICN